MRLESLLELNFLGMSFSMKEFGFDTEGLLSSRRRLVGRASFTLPSGYVCR